MGLVTCLCFHAVNHMGLFCFAMLGNFSKLFPNWHSFQKSVWIQIADKHFVWPKFGPNCLQRQSGKELRYIALKSIFRKVESC